MIIIRRYTPISAPFATALPLLLTLLAGGCGDAQGGAPRALVRDSAGVRIVESAGASWEEGEAWRIAAQPALEIGLAEGPPAYLLDQVRGARRLADGRVVIANSGSGELRFYGADGTHLRSVGGRGDGPGEYQDISWIDDFRGDSLLAYDARNRRVSVLSSDGTFGRAIASSRADLGSMPMVKAAFGDGTLLGRFLVPFVAGQVTTGMRRSNAVYASFSATDAALIDTVATIPDEERHILAEPQMMMVTSKLLPTRTYDAVAGDSLFLGHSGSFEIRVLGADGTLRQLIRRAGDPLAVSEAEVALLTEERLGQVDDENYRREMSRVLEMMPPPEARPAFSGLLVDDAGNLWVGETVLPGEPNHWSVFDPEGRMLGTLALPGDDFRPFHIGDDFILGVASDELDVQRVRMYEVEKG